MSHLSPGLLAIGYVFRQSFRETRPPRCSAPGQTLFEERLNPGPAFSSGNVAHAAIPRRLLGKKGMFSEVGVGAVLQNSPQWAKTGQFTG